MDNKADMRETGGLPVTGLTHDGRGVVRLDGRAVFVPGCWPGETVTVRLGTVKKNYAEGTLVRIETPSPERQDSPCPHPECGACSFLTLRYPAQLSAKQGLVEQALARIGGVSAEVVPCLGMDNPLAYRNKALFHAGVSDGKALLGFHRPGSNEVVEVPGCLLLKPGIRRIYALLREAVTTGEVAPGGIKDVLVRESGVLLVRFGVFREGAVPARLASRLKEAGIAIIQEAPADGKGTHRGNARELCREGELSETYGQTRFAFSPESFAQTNPEQAGKLYAFALEAAGPLTGKRVLDLYCGAGFLGLLAMREGAAALSGIEISRGAVADAAANARRLGMVQTRFAAGDAARLLPGLLKETRPEVVFVDPPRAGCTAAELAALTAARPERIVCCSCDPATFARDAKILLAGGYCLGAVQPVDMFPWTHHTELAGVFFSKQGQ